MSRIVNAIGHQNLIVAMLEKESVSGLQLDKIPRNGGVRVGQIMSMFGEPRPVEMSVRARNGNLTAIHRPDRVIPRQMVEKIGKSRNTPEFPADTALDSFFVAVPVFGDGNTFRSFLARVSNIEITEQAAIRKNLRLLMSIQMIPKREIKRRLMISPGQTLGKGLTHQKQNDKTDTVYEKKFLHSALLHLTEPGESRSIKTSIVVFQILLC